METDGYCWCCRKPCLGEVLKFEDHLFHPECLKCGVCHCNLASRPIFEYEDNYYCGEDYFQRYGQKCFTCREFIEGEALAVHGNVYHEACFVCTTCRHPFPEEEKINYDGKNYKCQKCSRPAPTTPTPAILQKCAGCGEELRGSQALLALEKQWHLWCFKCCRCGSMLSGEYMAKDGQPYCEKCYQNLFGIACAGCGSYITGKVLQAGSKHYHPRCSRCARCNQVFGEGEEMYLQGNEIWHPRCTDEALALEASKQVSAAPEPPARTASHHTEWNSRYQQNGLPDEKPVRKSTPRPYSYHDASSAAQTYASDRTPSAPLSTSVYRSDIKVPLDLKSKTPEGEPHVRRYSTEDKDKFMQRNFYNSDSDLQSSNTEPLEYFPYSALKTSNFKLPKGVDKTQLETYLTDKEFFDIFSMSKPDFYNLPKWKQNDSKKKKELF